MEDSPRKIDLKEFFLVFGLVVTVALVAANLLNGFISARLPHPKLFVATNTAVGSSATGRYIPLTTRRYSEATLGYTLDYPSSWLLEGLLPSKRVAGPVGAAIAPLANVFTAPDHHAYTVVIVGADAMTTSVTVRPYVTKDLQDVERGLLLDGVIPLHAVTFEFVQSHNETYVQGTVDVKAGQALRHEVALMGVRSGHVYIVMTSVTSNEASAPLESRQTRAILTSLTLAALR